MDRNALYDILCFENYHSAYHHQYDVVLIARLLQHGGMKVGILDIYQEIEKDEIEGIPVINIEGVEKLDFSNQLTGNKVLATLRAVPFFYKRDRYYKKVLAQVQDLADSFYCGSYNMWMSTAFMKLEKPCFYWGLRSSRMNFKLSHIWRENPFALRYSWIKRRFLSNKCQCLFVSNHIIKEEFLKLGVPAESIVIREERCVEQKKEGNEALLSENVRFLTIGQLRPEKQVQQTIEAFRAAKLENAELYLVGKGKDEGYDEGLRNIIGDDNRIHRVGDFLEYDAFNEHFAKAHFVVFADRQQMSSITNGTLAEALINHRPVIVPDYPPFNYYVNTYHVGLLFTPNDVNSYSEAMKKAFMSGASSFFPAIEEFLKKIDFESVSKELTANVRSIINKSKKG